MCVIWLPLLAILAEIFLRCRHVSHVLCALLYRLLSIRAMAFTPELFLPGCALSLFESSSYPCSEISLRFFLIMCWFEFS